MASPRCSAPAWSPRFEVLPAPGQLTRGRRWCSLRVPIPWPRWRPRWRPPARSPTLERCWSSISSRRSSPSAATRPSDEASSRPSSMPRRAAQTPVSVVLALRADFFGRCGAFPDFARLLEAGTTILPEMQADELRAAIEGPARVAGLRVEPESRGADRFRHPRRAGRAPVALARAPRDVEAAPPPHPHGRGLPRRRRRGRRDRRKRRSACTDRLDPAEQTLARRRLRSSDRAGGRVDRYQAPSVAHGVGYHQRCRDDRRTARRARRRGLITVHESSVEVAHEALIREWPRLRSWLDEDREGLRLHRHLTHAVERLGRTRSRRGGALPGTRLALVREWTTRSDHAVLNDLEREFLEASSAREAAEHVARDEQARRRERDNKRLRRLVAAMAIVVVIALLAGLVAFVQRDHASRSAHVRARRGTPPTSCVSLPSRRPCRAKIVSCGTLLALEANRMRDDAQTRGAVLLGSGRRSAADDHPADRHLAGRLDGALRRVGTGPIRGELSRRGLQDPPARLARFPVADVVAAAVRSDGLIAVADSHGTIGLRPVRSVPRPVDPRRRAHDRWLHGVQPRRSTPRARARDALGDPVPRTTASTVGLDDVAAGVGRSRRPSPVTRQA